MADFENGLPPLETDPSEGAITGMNYVGEALKEEGIAKEGEIVSMTLSKENYIDEDTPEQEIISFDFLAEQPEKLNFMSMT